MRMLTRNTHKLAALSVCSILVLILFSPVPVNAAELNANDTQDKRVKETSVELSKKGCVNGTAASVVFPPGVHFTFPDGFVAVVPYDAGRTVVEVAGPLPDINYLDPMFCPADVAATLTDVSKVRSELEPDPVISGGEQLFALLFTRMIQIAASVGLWLVQIGSYALGLFLGLGEFISHPFVRMGWPFVQGLANLGFMIALLFIAFTTVLQIEIGGLRRLLPRLLIAALLLNFSLIISGIIIDFSRITMAAIASLIQQDNCANGVKEVGNCLVLNSDAINGVFRLTTLQEGDTQFWAEQEADEINRWSIPRNMFRATVLIWGLAIGFWFAVAILLARYIALLLLLIVSPLAYLAFAFPGMGSYGKQWWTAFLKWVLYGPIVLFLLVLASMVGGQAPQGDNSFFNSLIATVFTIAVLILSATVGKSVGAAGAGAVIGYANRGKNMATNYVRKNPGKAAAIAAGVATGGVVPGALAAAGVYGGIKGGKVVGRFAKNQAGDAADVIKSRATDYIKGTKYKNWLPAKRDDKGRLKPGETSWLKKQAEDLIGPQGNKKIQAQAAAAVGTLAGGHAGNLDNPALQPAMLRQGHVTNAIGTDTVINDIAGQAKQALQVEALLENTDFMRGLSGAQRIEFVNNIRNNTNFEVMPPLAARTATESQQDFDQRKGRYDLRRAEKERDTKERLAKSALSAFTKLDNA